MSVIKRDGNGLMVVLVVVDVESHAHAVHVGQCVLGSRIHRLGRFGQKVHGLGKTMHRQRSKRCTYVWGEACRGELRYGPCCHKHIMMLCTWS